MQLPYQLREELSPTERDQLFHLWNREYPLAPNYESTHQLDQYLNQLVQARHYLLPDTEGGLLAWAATFLRDSERWFAIIIDAGQQGKGLGRQLLQLLQQHEPVLNGWVSDREDQLKADGSVYSIPLPFYLKNGFRIVPGERLDLPQLSALKIRWQAGA